MNTENNLRGLYPTDNTENSLRGLYPTDNSDYLLGHSSLGGPYMLIAQQPYSLRRKANLLSNVKEKIAWIVELCKIAK